MRGLFLAVLLLVVVSGTAAVAELGNEASVWNTPVVCTFENTDFATAMADLAKQSHATIMVDPKVQAKVSAELKDVALSDAIDYLARLAGAYPIQFDEHTWAIASLDPQGPYYNLISQTEIIPVNYVDVKEIIWYEGDKVSGLLARHPYRDFLVPDPTSNRISITAPPALIERLRADISQIDQPKRQILVEALILDTSQVKFAESGYEWERGVAFPKEEQEGKGVRTITFANTILGYSSDVNGRFLFNLYNWYSSDKLNIMAHPRVVVQDGEETQFYVGQDTYVPIAAVLGGPPAKVEPVKAGTSFRITARIIEDNQILVQLDSDVSEVIGTAITGFPIVNRRTVQSKLTVQNGETIIVAGLNSTFEYRRYNKIPILGDIPLIGNLFRSSRKDRRQQEITILVTPRILTSAIITKEGEHAEIMSQEMSSGK